MISPAVTHRKLESLLAETETDGPHTALIATPQGQIIVSASTRVTLVQEEESDEPWLDEPERQRLLLGLLSQWSEDESPRIECELGRLYLRVLKLPPLDTPAHTTSMPGVTSQSISSMVLLVNGTTKTPWDELAAKSGEFKLDY